METGQVLLSRKTGLGERVTDIWFSKVNETMHDKFPVSQVNERFSELKIIEKIRVLCHEEVCYYWALERASNRAGCVDYYRNYVFPLFQ